MNIPIPTDHNHVRDISVVQRIVLSTHFAVDEIRKQVYAPVHFREGGLR
jgi:hypothetical protein